MSAALDISGLMEKIGMHQGDRITWVREKLKLSRNALATLVGMPEASLRMIEKGGKSTNYHGLKKLTDFLDAGWQKRYSKNYPIFEGKLITRITFMWIIFGEDKILDEKISYEQSIEKQIRTLETDNILRQMGLKREISLLSEGVVE